MGRREHAEGLCKRREQRLVQADLGRKSWLFAGSDRRDQRAAFMLNLIATAKLNDIDPQVRRSYFKADVHDIRPSTASSALVCFRNVPNWRKAGAAPDLLA